MLAPISVVREESFQIGGTLVTAVSAIGFTFT